MNSAKYVNELVASLKSEGRTKTEIVIKSAEAELGWSYVWGATGQECNPSKRKAFADRSVCPSGESAVTVRKCQVLNGSRSDCTGCKWFPNQERTLIDDCQGFVKQILKRVGITMLGGGASSMWKTASNWADKGEINTLPERLCCIFWQNPKKSTTMDHVGFYIGNGMMVHCSGEVKKEKLSAKCTHWAIPKGLDGGDIPVIFPTLKKGSRGEYVTLLQTKLIQQGYDLSPYGADGSFGNKTLTAVKQFQRDHGLTSDGIIGDRTWEALNSGTTTLYTVTIQHVGASVANEIVKKYGGTMVAEGQ